MYNEQRKLFADATQQDAVTIHRSSANRSPNRSSTPADLAALTVTCQAILNLDATIYER